MTRIQLCEYVFLDLLALLQVQGHKWYEYFMTDICTNVDFITVLDFAVGLLLLINSASVPL